MADEVFKFKRFEVFHGKGSMKVGVDAVLLGSWIENNNERINILDIGTGCGIIALILAQRFPNAEITGIDIDPLSIEESEKNFMSSQWRERLCAKMMNFPEEIGKFENKFDLIVSNPPYFRSGVSNPVTQREKARHQDSLSIFSILKNAPNILKANGRLAMIFPSEFEKESIETGWENGLIPLRICKIRNKENKIEKRIMLEFSLKRGEIKMPEIERLILFKNSENSIEPTEEYRRLCKDLYLRF